VPGAPQGLSPYQRCGHIGRRLGDTYEEEPFGACRPSQPRELFYRAEMQDDHNQGKERHQPEGPRQEPSRPRCLTMLQERTGSCPKLLWLSRGAAGTDFLVTGRLLAHLGKLLKTDAI
jgi:hypothetical protein